MGFVIVLLLTGVVNVALVPQAERVGKGGDSPRKKKGKSGEKSKSQQDEKGEIEEDEYQEQRLANTRIGKTAKMEKSAAYHASRRNDEKETTLN